MSIHNKSIREKKHEAVIKNQVSQRKQIERRAYSDYKKHIRELKQSMDTINKNQEVLNKKLNTQSNKLLDRMSSKELSVLN